MTTPLRSLPGPAESLGREGTDEYLRCGSEVYRKSGPYVYPHGSYRTWEASTVARRIQAAQARRERERGT